MNNVKYYCLTLHYTEVKLYKIWFCFAKIIAATSYDRLTNLLTY